MQTLDSKITDVTVYRRGALVTRVAELPSLAEGKGDSLRLTNLPLSMSDASVRVRIEGEGEELATATSLRVALETGDIDTSLPPARDEELLDARREEARVNKQMELLKGQLSRIKKLAVPPRPAPEEGKPPPASPLKGRLMILEFREVEVRRLSAEIRELQATLREARKRRQHQELRRQQASTARQVRENELKKTLICGLVRGQTEVGPQRLVLQYLVPGARWVPAYTINLDRGLREARLAVRAAVCQRSGENWDDVRLTLSTAASQSWTELPELTSIRIGRRQPPKPIVGWRLPPEGAAALYDDYERDFSGDPSTLTGGGAAGDEAWSLGGVEDAPIEEDDDPDATSDFEEEIDARNAELDDGMLPAAPPAVMAAGPTASGMVAPMSMPAMAASVEVGAPGDATTEMAMPKARSVRSSLAGKAAKKRDGPDASFGGAVGARFMPPEEPEPARLAASEDLLAYADLRMAAPEAVDRGRLRPASQEQLYLELIEEHRVSVSFNVMRTVRRAIRIAESAADTEPPPRHIPPRDGGDGFDYAYVAQSAVEIPSDGAFHAIPLLEKKGDATPRFITVPRESQDVFRVVTVNNPLAAPLLPGPADIYVGGEYLLTSQVKQTPAGAELELGLGVEQSIKVARNTHFEEHTTGLIRGTLGLKHDIDVEIQNHLGKTATVEVRERLPVSRERDDDVEVKIEEVEQTWEPYEQEEHPIDGGYRWEVSVGAGQKKNLHASYIIRLPAKHELVGGNRREW